MVKKALCVGINDYPYDGCKLKGCVNDARAWADLLISSFLFPLIAQALPRFSLHVEYSATEREKALDEVIRAIDEWGERA